MVKNISVKEIQKKISLISAGCLSLDESTYVNVNVVCRFFDVEHGEWWTKPSNVLYQKQSHPKKRYAKVSRALRSKQKNLENKIRKIHGNEVSLDYSTFKNNKTKCRFIDKDYGEWWATPSNVVSRKSKHPLRASLNRKNTCQKKYGAEYYLKTDVLRKKMESFCIENFGVDNPTKCKDIRLAAARTAGRIKKEKHWFSMENLECQGSWELKVVRFFNKNKVDFLWQPQTFLMPSGKTYTPDLYLINEDLWIEIKGRRYPDSMKKWEWFNNQYPNSELWDLKILRSKNIL